MQAYGENMPFRNINGEGVKEMDIEGGIIREYVEFIRINKNWN